MKRISSLLALVIVAGVAFPSAAHAAWWKPATWKKTKTATSTSATTTATNYESPIDTSFLPTVDELKKRIAELEDKLDKARRDAKEEIEKARKEALAEAKASSKGTVEPKSVAEISPSNSSDSGLSAGKVASKVRPAIVFVETTTGSGAGVVIDGKGHILLPARIVLIKDVDSGTVRAAAKVNVTLSDGAKKTAELIGIHEAHNIAVYLIPDDGSFSYVSPTYDSGVAKGDTVYLFNGTSYVSGVVARKDGDGIEITTGDKPAENGGILVGGKGTFVGFTGNFSCKVLEEMKTCLKYSVTATNIKSAVPKLFLGMKLYGDKKGSTAQENLVRGQLDGVYRSMRDNSTIDYAVSSATGKNSFDNFNTKLGQDQEGKITKLYLAKLKSIAENMYRASDSLKSHADNLNIFFINEESRIEQMDIYQRKILAEIRTENEAKLKEYSTKVNFWSKKKNEYDSYLADTSKSTHDYLLEEGAFIESSTAYFTAEKKRILDTFSGEVVQLF